MLFKSPIVPEVRSPQELIVLHLVLPEYDSRVLIPLPDTYETLVNVASATFGFSLDASHKVRFFTQELAGSSGHNVEIKEDVWIGIKYILSLIIVEPYQLTPGAHVGASRKSIAPPPDRVVQHAAGSAPSKEIVEAGRRLSRMSLGLGLERRASRMSSVPDAAKRRASRRSMVPSPTAREEAEASNHALHDEEDELEEDEEEEEIMFGSKSVGKRQVIASEDEAEMVDEQVEALPEEEADENGAHAKRPEPPREPSWELSWEQREPSREPSPPPPKTPGTPAAKKEQRGSAQRALSQAAPTPKVKQEKAQVASSGKTHEIRLEHNDHAGVASTSQSQLTDANLRSQSQTQSAGADERFVVIIEYDDGSGDETQTLFKTRGRHLISKVLAHACRTFDIEHLYDRAQLLLAIDMEEDGKITEHRYVCPKNDTMADIGAWEESRFIIKVNA